MSVFASCAKTETMISDSYSCYSGAIQSVEMCRFEAINAFGTSYWNGIVFIDISLMTRIAILVPVQDTNHRFSTGHRRSLIIRHYDSSDVDIAERLFPKFVDVVAVSSSSIRE